MINVCVCVCVCSVLRLIPQLSPERGEASGVAMELPVKAGLAVLQVGDRGSAFIHSLMMIQ